MRRIILLTTVILSMAAANALGGKSIYPGPFHYKLVAVDSISGPGKATFDFSIWKNPSFPKEDTRCRDAVPVRLTMHGNLVNLGPSEWQVLPPDSPGTSIIFSVNIPDNDTTGFTLEGPCWVGPRSVYFITTGYYPAPNVFVPIEVFDGDPRIPTYRHGEPKWKFIEGDWRQVEGGAELYDENGNRIEPDYSQPARRQDTTSQPFIKVEVFHHDEDSLKRARVEWEIRNRETLEQSPLVGQQYEYIEVDGVTLVRKEGEYKFYPAQGEKDVADMVAEVRRHDDSLTEAMSHVMYDALLTLTRPEQLTFARQFVDTLTPIDTVDMYRASINRGTWGKLIREGITVRLWNDTVTVRKRKESK